ncbi:MAG: pentapeptide repeat-containing protein [Chloroflexi bacterium]|nr:pentapeptide repeat-containing protein [Chloroflexota bacterium]
MAEERKGPLTRADVLKLIEESGGKTEGLDLSGQIFVEAIDLSGLDLRGIILKDARFPTDFEDGQQVGAKFNGSDLTGADLRSINLQYAQFKKLDNQPTCLAGVDLRSSLLLNANFQGADLTGAQFGGIPSAAGYPATLEGTDLRGANLFRANFEGCYFYDTKLEGAYIRGADIFDAYLEEIDWGKYKIGEESKKENLHSAESIYRQLKQWYTNAGIYDVAGKFLYRELEARRKSRSWKAEPHLKLWDWIWRLLCGYGEEWPRVIIWAATVVFGLALIYFAIGTLTPNTFLNSLYYSAVSFTALGYGTWAPNPTGWVKGLGAVEAFVGVFMMALFLVTFTRKMTR